MVPSGNMKTSLQGGDIYVSSSGGTLGPVSEVHSVFSKRDVAHLKGNQKTIAVVKSLG